jgi:UDP-glucuronate 4-epimerase
MSPFLFAEAILTGKPIKIFNYGDMMRDFTYIDDVVKGLVRVLDKPATAENPTETDIAAKAPYRIFNIGNSQPEKLMDFIGEMENALGKEAIKEFLPMQPGDVEATFADTSALEAWIGFKPATTLKHGLSDFIKWYVNFHPKFLKNKGTTV